MSNGKKNEQCGALMTIFNVTSHGVVKWEDFGSPCFLKLTFSLFQLERLCIKLCWLNHE